MSTGFGLFPRLNANICLPTIGECDMADEVCEECEQRTCSATLYLTDEEDETDLVYTCDSIACIKRAVEDRHFGEEEPFVEVQGPSKPILINDDGEVVILAA